MKDILIKEYNNIVPLKRSYKQPHNTVNFNFIDGPFIEIMGPNPQEYKIQFKDLKKNLIVHEAEISNNMWTRANLKYCIDWYIEVTEKTTGQIIFTHQFNPKDKKVYIHLDSSSIGDTLAWFPYIEEFRKKWDCTVVSSTFHNDWFKGKYPHLKFVTPGSTVEGLYAMFSIGWFYNNQTIDKDRIPIDFKRYPLQQTASEILNLLPIEVKPLIKYPNKSSAIKKDYVVIAPHASSHAKYWNHPGGWQTIINYLNDKGYEVAMITQESASDEWHNSKLGQPLYNIIDKTGDFPLQSRMVDIKHAKAFIGVGSGLSWVSWALNTPTILISGFSYPYTEFQDCERIFPKDPKTCMGCFNKHWLNPGDWEWCPEHKDTPRQFECTKSITPEMVIKSLQKVLDIY
jgi:autotransporter strand-loop-strand O-heptosyltransferase